MLTTTFFPLILAEAYSSLRPDEHLTCSRPIRHQFVLNQYALWDRRWGEGGCWVPGSQGSVLASCQCEVLQLSLPSCCHQSELFVFYWCVVVQSLSHMQLIATPWTAACQASLTSTISWSWLKFMSIESVMLSNHLILCHPFLLLPSVFPSIKVFSDKLALCIGGQSISTSASA